MSTETKTEKKVTKIPTITVHANIDCSVRVVVFELFEHINLKSGQTIKIVDSPENREAIEPFIYMHTLTILN